MIRSLQACRAVAALLVVLLHTSEGIFALPKYFASRPLGHFFAFGGAGVDFFFVLSGFIIAHVHWDDIGSKHRLRAYIAKRLTRIYPVYWAALVPVLAVFLLVPAFGKGHERDPGTILCSLVLLPLPSGEPVLIVSWSLVFEVFFYTLFGLLIASRRWGGLAMGAWLAVVLACITGRLTTFPWTFVGSVYHLEFVSGAALALAVKHYDVPAPRCLVVVGAAIFLATGMVEVHIQPQRTLGHLAGYTAGSMLVLAGVIEAERSALLKPPRLLVFLGDASYSIYLVHFPALSVLAKLAKALHVDAYVPALALFCLLAAGATIVGCLFHLVVERPLLRYYRRPGTVREKAAIAGTIPARAAPQRKAA
jgi:peptidoglycan/LPS O-acetylase OafA/YrhL